MSSKGKNEFENNKTTKKNVKSGVQSLEFYITGSNATDYAGLGLDCTGGPDIPFPFFTQSAEEPKKIALGLLSVSVFGE